MADSPDYIVISAEPEKIIDEMRAFPQFSAFVQQNYEFIESFNKVLIYQLKKKLVKTPLFNKEAPVVPLQLIKRFSAITKIEDKNGQTEVTFEPMVSPEGILRSFKTTYLEPITIDFEPITLEFFGKDGYDYVGVSSQIPSGTTDLHIRARGNKKPISFIRVKMEKITWNNHGFGVNPAIKAIQNMKFLDLYFEPPSGWQGKTFYIYIIYEDGSISASKIVGAVDN